MQDGTSVHRRQVTSPVGRLWADMAFAPGAVARVERLLATLERPQATAQRAISGVGRPFSWLPLFCAFRL